MKSVIVRVCAVVFLFNVSLLAQSPPDDLAAAKAKLEAAKRKYTETHPGVVALQKQVSDVEYAAGIRSAKSNLVSPLTALQTRISGTFWRNPMWVETLGLTADQQTKMDDLFQQYRLKLIDLKAGLEKEELILEPLVGGTKPPPDAEAKILTQIDRIANARAELEKANSRMLVSILQTLTPEQWSKLPATSKKGVYLK
jgi:Spy/CpxP family protein refolding chaperone